MAASIIPFKQSTYFKLHSGIDQFLLERVIFPEFERQSQLGNGSEGIELPVGINQPPEHISLDEARQLILDYLINTKNLGEKDQRTLNRVSGYEEFIKYAYGLYQRRIEDTTSLTTASRLQALEQLQKTKTKVSVVDQKRFNSDARIRQYNELYLQLLKTSSLGAPAKTLSQLFRNGITNSTDVNQLMLAQVIAENLPRLYKAGSLGTSPEMQSHRVATELRYIIAKSHPELSGFTNLLGDNQVKASLHSITTAMGNAALKQDSKIFQKFETAQLNASQSLSTHLLNESELRVSIFNTLPVGNTKERQILTDQILREVTKNSLDPKQIKDIIYNLNLQDPQKQLILQTLQSSGLDASLEYRQGELYVLANSRRLTSGEVGLIKRGINPFLTTQDPTNVAFITKEQKLLAEYNSNPPQSR